MSVLRPLEQKLPIVNCYNEWDPLEEVIVGVVDGACVPPWHVSLKATMPRDQWSFFEQHGGKPFPPHLIDAARRDLDGFVHRLEAEGVTVRRPEIVDWSRPYGTPDWQVASGLYAAMPRDVLLVVGDEIIEAPLSWRSRYHETDAYHPLLAEYLRGGARWTAAPRPRLLDELYEEAWEEPAKARSSPTSFASWSRPSTPPTSCTAAATSSCRRATSPTTSASSGCSATWGRTTASTAWRGRRAPHAHRCVADAARPRQAAGNPERIQQVPAIFKSWDVLRAPRSFSEQDFCMCSSWVNMNVLMLDERRMLVEAQEEPFIRAVESWGFEPIRCPFPTSTSSAARSTAPSTCGGAATCSRTSRGTSRGYPRQPEPG